MQATLHVDGGSRGNPGPAAAGVVITDSKRRVVIHEAGYFLGKMTNNSAEYLALIRAAELAKRLGVQEARIISDSELIVRQITGEYRVKSADLKPLHQQAQRLLLQLGAWRIEHVPREQNARADQLANMALDAGADCLVVNGDAGEVDYIPTAPAKAPKQPTNNPAGDGLAIRIVGRPDGACALGCQADVAHAFGPHTADGLCVYAAKAALTATPIEDAKRMKMLRRIETACPKCGLTVAIELRKT